MELLCCPVCKEKLQREEKRYCCKNGHSFDIAKQNYVNLLRSQKSVHGDDREMVVARRDFLEKGYYAPLRKVLCDEVSNRTPKNGVLVDAGCGEGYYTNRMGTICDAFGVDLSRAGIDAAAKTARNTQSRAAFAVGSLFTLPVQDESFDVLTNLFAPCAESEFLRVLKPGGTLVLVGAGERHLFGLKEILYENPYLNPGRADLPRSMPSTVRRRLTYSITVEGREQIEALFSMTPYYWRTSPADRQKLESLKTLTTDVDFDIFLFRKGQ